MSPRGPRRLAVARGAGLVALVIVGGVIALTSSGGRWPMTPIDAPRLTWTSANASVTVEGPGVASSQARGSVPVCPPNGATGAVCPTLPVGTYAWRPTLRDAAGAIVHTQVAVLVASP